MKLYAKEGEAPHHQSIIIDEDTGETVAVTYRDDDGSRGRLLAAAPELLEALGNAVVLVHHIANHQRITDIDVAQANAALPLIRAAIAKATQA